MTEQEAGPGGINRRRAPRVPMAEGGPVTVVGAKLLDMSPFGMMVESVMPLPVDSTHAFRVVVEGVRRDVKARVACCTPRPGPRRAFGVGLEFVDADTEWREHVRSVLQRWTETHARG